MAVHRAVFALVLIVAGAIWCKEVFGRLGTDIAEFAEHRDGYRRFAIVFMWLLTVVIVAALVGTGIVLVGNVRDFLN